MYIPNRDEFLTHTVLTEVDWQAGRDGHTVNSLLAALTEMRLVDPSGNQRIRLYSYARALILICDMISRHVLEIDGNGHLQVAEIQDPALEMFQGDWYVTNGKTIRGPLKRAEAVKCLA